MSAQAWDAEGEYDPASYARGAVSYSEKEESDSCGLSERGHVGLLGLFTEHGVKNIPYHGIDGVDQDGAKDCRWLEINFHAVIELPDLHGEVKKREGFFKARIEGKRLEPLMRQIRVGRRVTIHSSGPVEDQKRAQVDSVVITGIEPEAF